MRPSDDIKKEITKDKNAQTIKEIAKDTGLADATIRRHANKMIELKKWRQVWKKQGKIIVAAYIRI